MDAAAQVDADHGRRAVGAAVRRAAAAGRRCGRPGRQPRVAEAAVRPLAPRDAAQLPAREALWVDQPRARARAEEAPAAVVAAAQADPAALVLLRGGASGVEARGWAWVCIWQRHVPDCWRLEIS